MSAQMTPVRTGDPHLAVHGLSVRFGGLSALDDVSLDVHDGRGRRPHRPERRRQDDAVQRGLRAGPAERRVDHGRRAPLPPDPTRLSARGVARTLQGLGLFRGLTVRENVLAGRLRTPTTPAPTRSASSTRSASPPHADRPVGVLPYPERKRVALARALVDAAAAAPARRARRRPRRRRHRRPRRPGPATPPRTGCAVLLVEHHVDFVMGVVRPRRRARLRARDRARHARRGRRRPARRRGLPRDRGDRLVTRAPGGARPDRRLRRRARCCATSTSTSGRAASSPSLGANGAGKTTLLRTLSGLVPAHAGSIRLDGAGPRRGQRRGPRPARARPRARGARAWSPS